jgi:signal transduction histidine kinase
VRFRFPAPRVLVGLTVLALLLVDLHGLMSTIAAHGAVRERAFRSIETRLLAARPQLLTLLGPSGTAAVEPVLDQVLASGLGTAASIRTLEGRVVGVRGSRNGPTGPRPPAAPPDEAVLGGRVSLTGPALGGAVIAEMALRPSPETLLLATTVPVPDVVLDLQARRALFLGQGLTLLLLILLGAAVLLPMGEPGESTPAHALLAYEAAMDRLRSRGEELSVRHERERQRLFEEAEDREALARAGELTAGIVHEVRNGLGTILGYARLLEKGADEEARAHGHSIREECETLETVVRRFMDFVRRETLTPLPFPLARTLQRVAARESRSRKGAAVTVAPEDPGTIVADEELLERAFENVVRNAREAAGEKGHVKVVFGQEPGAIVVTVIDDGPGLDAAARNRLRPFFSTKSGGLGLGLPIALKIVRLHGGDLSFEDESPGGLRVRIRLPREPDSDVTNSSVDTTTGRRGPSGVSSESE